MIKLGFIVGRKSTKGITWPTYDESKVDWSNLDFKIIREDMKVENEDMPVIGVLAPNPDVDNIDVVLPYKECGNVGWDLCSVEEVEIPPRERVLVDTGLVCDFPGRLYGLIWPRSGLAVKNGIDVLAGCIDTIYRGRIKVALINHSDEFVKLPSGAKIAQMLVLEEVECKFKWVSQVNETIRGTKGFGSSGV